MNRSVLAVSLAALMMAGCNGSGDSVSVSKVSFSVSDAPVDSASVVMIAFDKIELVPAEGDSLIYDVDPDGNNDYQQIDLLQVQGTSVDSILAGQDVPVGTYQNLILHVEPTNGLNYVVDNSGNQPLKQPSNKLRLGAITIAEQPTQAFTIEFDLRQSLVMRGNQNNNNGYILKPHGVSIVASDIAASLSGTVDASLLAEGNCVAESGNFVYLYSGTGLDATKLVDMVDTEDEAYTGTPALPEGSQLPYTSAPVDDQTNSPSYEVGNLPPGSYTVAFSCDADGDDPVNLDSLTIPNPAASIGEVTLGNSEAGSFNFPALTP